MPLKAKIEDPQWVSWSRKDGVIYAHAPAWALGRVVALRVHLDPSTSENGPLRVVPGSHEAGVLTDEAVSLYAKTHEQAVSTVSRGGVIAMRPLLIHGSSKCESSLPRRVVHIDYANCLDLAPGIQLAVA